jgi:DNA modification methylase
MLIPARVAMALQADGWYLRSDIIWHKPNVMPEGGQYSRPTRSHEHIFLLSRSAFYYYDHEAIKEPCDVRGGMKNVRDVWSIPTGSFKGAHFAVFPLALPERCILASTKVDDVVLDPFMGSGTTGLAAVQLKRKFVGIELNREYLDMASSRLLDAMTSFQAMPTLPL